MPAKRQIRRSFVHFALLLCLLVLLLGPMMAPAWSPNSAVAFAQGASAATRVTVTTTSDVADGNTTTFDTLILQPGPDGAISLREAVVATNSMSTTAPLTIAFNIPTADGGYNAAEGTWTIVFGAQALPPLAHGSVTIDGASQPGAAGRPRIVLDGYNVYEAPGDSNGLTISSDHNTIRGLTLMNFYDDALLIVGTNATANLIVGCYLGPSAVGGPAAQPSYFGVELRDGAHNNTIGGADPAARNLISGNAHSGVFMQGATTHTNLVLGNWIGTDASGRAALKNMVAGVLISGGAHAATVGGPNAGNLISGNDVGVYLDGTVDTIVAGNTIGLAADRATPLGNVSGGIFIMHGSHRNRIGGTTAAARNVISGNGAATSSFGQGIYVADAETTNNTIQGNYIGVAASGVAPAGNYRQGVLVGEGAHNNLIGGVAAGAANVIAYNGLGGVRIDSPANQVVGNLIGVGADGATALGNQFNGVRVGGDNTTIGPGNRIAYNQHSGILLLGSHTTVLSNTLESNGRSGICVAGPHASITGNRIERNGGAGGPWPDCAIRGGVVITSTNAALVQGNQILFNHDAGVTVYDGRGNRILANSISDNGASGIRLTQGGNDELAPPRILNVSATVVSGTACARCRVEIFTDLADQGRHFVGATTAGGNGSFTLQVAPGVLRDPYVTATHTDGNGNTSSFARAFNTSLPPPTPPTTLFFPAIYH